MYDYSILDRRVTFSSSNMLFEKCKKKKKCPFFPFSCPQLLLMQVLFVKRLFCHYIPGYFPKNVHIKIM